MGIDDLGCNFRMKRNEGARRPTGLCSVFSGAWAPPGNRNRCPDAAVRQLTWSLPPHPPAGGSARLLIDRLAPLSAVAPRSSSYRARACGRSVRMCHFFRWVLLPDRLAQVAAAEKPPTAGRAYAKPHHDQRWFPPPYVGRFACGWHRLSTTDLAYAAALLLYCTHSRLAKTRPARGDPCPRILRPPAERFHGSRMQGSTERRRHGS